MINNEKDLLEKIDENLKNIKAKNALTHCITNSVTINDCANAVLAIGGSPFMAEDAEELEEVVSIADVLVITIVLDPVGVGVTELRNKTTMDLIENYDIAAIRGNISEIKAIAKLSGVLDESNTAKGVDVNADDIITEKNLKANGDLICELANKLNTVILASGPLDILSDGETTVVIDNGDEMMPLITGSGCMLSSIVGSCIGGTNPFDGSLTAILAMNIAGEKARAKVNARDEGTGSFRAYLIDYLYKTDSKTLVNESNIKIL